MRILAAIAIASLIPLATAQTVNCPLGQPLTSPNQGNAGGGIYFNLTVTQTVTFVNLNYVASDASVAGNSSLEMYVGPATWVGNVSANPGPWTLVATTTPVPIAAAVDTPVTGVLNPAGPNPGPICFGPGTYGIALKAVGHSWAYQNGAFTFTAPGNEFAVATGGASNAFLTLPTFSPRTINGSIDYTVGGTPMPFARRTPYGAGCYKLFRSFYELMPSTATGQDLSNTSIRFTIDTSNNRWSNVAFQVPPVAVVPPTSAPLAGVLNDSNITVPLGGQPILYPGIGGIGIATTSVEMNSNGYVNLAGTNPVTPANPTAAAFLSGTARIGNWANFDPTVAPGAMHYDFDAVNSVHLFTWNQVNLSTIANSPSTFQIAFFANGDAEIRFGTMSLAGGGGWPTLVGYTPGGNSADPGTVDLSAALPLNTAGIDQPPLTLSATTNPVLGSTVNLVTSNVTGQPLPSVGICFVCVADLPVSPTGLDLAIIGAPGCVANVDINAGAGYLVSNLPGLSLTLPFPIPSSPPTIVGLSFYCQSVWLDSTQNAAGLLSSNAVNLKLGLF